LTPSLLFKWLPSYHQTAVQYHPLDRPVSTPVLYILFFLAEYFY